MSGKRQLHQAGAQPACLIVKCIRQMIRHLVVRELVDQQCIDRGPVRLVEPLVSQPAEVQSVVSCAVFCTNSPGGALPFGAAPVTNVKRQNRKSDVVLNLLALEPALELPGPMWAEPTCNQLQVRVRKRRVVEMPEPDHVVREFVQHHGPLQRIRAGEVDPPLVTLGRCRGTAASSCHPQR